MTHPESFEKVSFTPELDKVLDQLMGHEFLPHTCQIFERTTDAKMKPFGSGVMALLGGSYYILTASHVAEYLTDETPLFIRRAGGYISIIGDVRVTDLDKNNEIDLAYIKLSPELLPILEGGYRFLPLSKIRKHSNLFYATQYCVFGYPQDSTKEIDGKLESQAEGYFVEPSKERVYQHYKYDPTACFVLDFKGKGKDVRTGIDRKVTTQPHGLSGCGLWLTLPSYNGKDWTVDYRLIGIMTEFKNGKYFCLVGNRIELLINAIQEFEGLDFKTKPIA